LHAVLSALAEQNQTVSLITPIASLTVVAEDKEGNDLKRSYHRRAGKIRHFYGWPAV
jgi:hypothetical protein